MAEGQKSNANQKRTHAFCLQNKQLLCSEKNIIK